MRPGPTGVALWVRSPEGQAWGPLSANQILAMIGNGLISGVNEASRDGRRYGPLADEPLLNPGAIPSAQAADPAPPSLQLAPPPTARTLPPAGAPTAGRTVTAPGVPSPGRTSTPVSGLPQRPTAPSAGVPARAATPPSGVLGSQTSAPPAAGFPPAPSASRPIQAAPSEGSLEEHSAFKLYYLIAAAEAGGLLTLGEGRNAVQISFKQGTPQAVRCEAMGLGQFLIEQRVIQPAALASAEPHILRLGGDVASGLFAAGLLNPSTGFPLIQQHAQTVLQRGLMADTGPFRYDPEAAAPASGFSIGGRYQLLSGAARRLDPVSLRRRLAKRGGQAPTLAGSTAELQLSAQETRLLTQLDGSRPLADLVAGSGALGETLERLVVLLSDIDRLTWSGEAAPARRSSSFADLPAAPAPSAAVPPPFSSTQPRPTPAPLPVSVPSAAPAAAAQVPSPPSAPAPVRPAAAPGTISPRPGPAKAPAPRPPGPTLPAPAPRAGSNSNLPALRKLREDLEEKDFFARLSVAKTKAPMPMLKMSYLQLAKLYHPDTVPPDAPPEARELKQKILALINEAYGVLSNDAQRVDYVDELEAREAVGDLDVEAILNAEEDFQQAAVLARSRKFAEALALLERCIATNPKEGEFYAWRGYCRFFSSQDKRAWRTVAVEDMRKALTLSPRCAVAWLFQGQIAKLLEDHPTAKEAFQKTLELDPQNIEAQRELRLYEQRKR